MDFAISSIHWLAGIVVLAEALNKLERTAPCLPGLTPHQRTVVWLKAMAWALLALGAGGAIVTPMIGSWQSQAIAHRFIFHQDPSFADTLVLVGFATLIVRTRVKEG
jgi:hypothetical protein